MKTMIIENFPTWALNYVINGEPCEDDEDTAMIDRYIDLLEKSLGWEWLDFTTPDNDNNTYFSAFPEFGLACDCCDIVVFTD